MAPSLEDLAQQYKIALYARYESDTACQVLEVDEGILATMREEGLIEYSELPGGHIRYFGYQILDVLLQSIRNLPQAKPRNEDQIIRFPEAHQMCGLSRTTIWRKMEEGSFPAKVVLSANSVGWWKGEIEEWLASRERGNAE